MALVPIELLEYARALRTGQTSAEGLIWGLLRNRRFRRLKWRRQVPIGGFIVDFFCAELNLAIELDGGQHNLEETKQKDAFRTRLLNKQGVSILRFWNNEVYENLEGVLSVLWNEVDKRLQE